MKILNTDKEDYHVHSMNFSDGFNTIDEIVHFAGEIGMKKIAITDHSQAMLDSWGIPMKTFRSLIKRWRNVYNNGVEVIFGIEADLLDGTGNICDHIHNNPSDFLILSYHHDVYPGNPLDITDGFLRAIEKNHSRIKLIGHPHVITPGTDVEKIVEAANAYNIPLELNCKYLPGQGHTAEKLDIVLKKADAIYVNGDCHTLHDLANARKAGFKFLKEKGYM